MNDSVKCLGFSELLKHAFFAVLVDKNGKEEVVEVIKTDVLKEFSLAKEHGLRKLWENRPRFAFNKEEWIDADGEPISDEVAEYWFADFDKVFDETFSMEKGSLQEKKECPK